jgi:hypothetical protein
MAQEAQTLGSFGDMDLQVVGTSRSRDWLPDMIFAARTIATGAEFVPLPCVRGAFAAVVIFLETVEVPCPIIGFAPYTDLNAVRKSKETVKI